MMIVGPQQEGLGLLPLRFFFSTTREKMKLGVDRPGHNSKTCGCNNSVIHSSLPDIFVQEEHHSRAESHPSILTP